MLVFGVLRVSDTVQAAAAPKAHGLCLTGPPRLCSDMSVLQSLLGWGLKAFSTVLSKVHSVTSSPSLPLGASFLVIACLQGQESPEHHSAPTRPRCS